MTRHPHLVFITSLVADGAPSTGYEVANQAVIDALRRLGARVTVIGYARPGATAGPDTIVLGETDPATHGATTARKLRWLWKALTQSLPISVAKHRIVNERQFQSALAKAGPADALVLNAVQMSAAYERLLTRGSYFYIAHNVEYRSAAENAAAAHNPLLRLLYRRESRLLKMIEERLCGEAQFVFTLADEDRVALGLANAGQSASLPLVTSSRPPSPPAKRQTSCDAALIGTWTWQPNLIGLTWFLDEVLPLLPQDFSVHIAGATPAGLAGRYPRAHFAGRVPDAASFVRSGRIVPLVSRAGTGVQLKSIETFELGLPSVATRHSLRGIPEVPENCIVADDAASFAAALAKAARTHALPDLDGTSFHRRQMERLDQVLADAFAAAGIALPERAR